MKNWKTSVAGIITAVAGFVLFSPMLFAKWPWVSQVATYIMAGGFAALGLTAKDSTSHSTAAEVSKSTQIDIAQTQAKAIVKGAENESKQ